IQWISSSNAHILTITPPIVNSTLSLHDALPICVVLGAMVLPVLRNLVNFLEIKDAIIPAVIGLTLLFGTIVDEFIRRRSAVRKRSEEHTSELQSRSDLVCRLLLEKKSATNENEV